MTSPTTEVKSSRREIANNSLSSSQSRMLAVDLTLFISGTIEARLTARDSYCQHLETSEQNTDSLSFDRKAFAAAENTPSPWKCSCHLTASPAIRPPSTI